MFTGIVTGLAKLIRKESVATGVRLIFTNPYGVLEAGESIAINGTCLTVESFTAGEMQFFLSPETLARTNLGAIPLRGSANTERALQATARLSGHIVQGHVDGLAQLVLLQREGEVFRLEFEIPETLARYCVAKGSICLDGISLTINEILAPGHRLWIQVIPHTWNHTNLAERRVGDAVNLEVDIVAKYVERLCEPHRTISVS